MNKTYIRSVLATILLGVSFSSYSQIITTIAGVDTAGFSGDGGLATLAELNAPAGVGIDGSGNVYIADFQNNRIRIVDNINVINTFAGNGVSGFAGDGGPAPSAELSLCFGVTTDASGNVYISDTYNARIRKVNTSGIISTFAGNGVAGYSGDTGPASAAEFDHPTCVALDASGNFYITDNANSRVRIINPSGIINTFAGNGSIGFSGDTGPASAAELFGPAGVGIDASGNIYIADAGNNCVRKVNTSGIINTIAGNGISSYSGDGGPATAAELNSPYSVAFDAMQNLYIADLSNNRIREVNTSGIISTIAGNGFSGFSGDGGLATDAEIHGPSAIAINASGSLFIGDENNNRIRKIKSVTGISELPGISNEITIFPVPTTGIFTIAGLSQGKTIEVYNYTGQKILSAICNQQSANFDISNYANGIYLVRILNKDGSVATTKKIVKTE